MADISHVANGVGSAVKACSEGLRGRYSSIEYLLPVYPDYVVVGKRDTPRKLDMYLASISECNSTTTCTLHVELELDLAWHPLLGYTKPSPRLPGKVTSLSDLP